MLLRLLTQEICGQSSSHRDCWGRRLVFSRLSRRVAQSLPGAPCFAPTKCRDVDLVRSPKPPDQNSTGLIVCNLSGVRVRSLLHFLKIEKRCQSVFLRIFSSAPPCYHSPFLYDDELGTIERPLTGYPGRPKVRLAHNPPRDARASASLF